MLTDHQDHLIRYHWIFFLFDYVKSQDYQNPKSIHELNDEIIRVIGEVILKSC